MNSPTGRSKMNLEKIKNKVIPIFNQYGVNKAAFFGSSVRSENTDESDIDILVELPEEASLLDLAGLKIDLEERLGRKVDVITYGSLHPLLKDKILSEEVAIL